MGGGFTPPPGGMAPPGAIMRGAHEPAWSPMEAVSFGWNVVTKRFATVALPLAVGLLVNALLANVVSLGGGFTVGVLTEHGVLDRDLAPIASMSVSGIGAIVSFVVVSYMLGGLTTTALKAARGQPTTFADPFSGGQYFVQFLVALIVGGLASVIGYALCLIPGIIVTLGLSLQAYLIVDQGLSGVDALKKSWEITKGHRLNIFFFCIIAFFVYLAGLLACFIGALLISAPLLMVAFAWIYMRIKGEPIPAPT
jgi:hypothetical protein